MKTASKLQLGGVILLAAVIGTVYLSYRYYRPTVAEFPRGLEIVEGGTLPDGIPAITDPTFERPVAADQYLKNDGLGLDVVVNKKHRFYPYQILVWHQIVNDEFFVVTYDPLSGAGRVWEQPTGSVLFQNSGKLLNNNMLMSDNDGGDVLWQQMTGVAVAGDRAGAMLESYPSEVVTWQDWKTAYPTGEVLSRDTGYERDYTRDPYGNYATSNAVLFPLSHIDGRLPLKDIVYGVIENGVATAYPAELIDEEKISMPEDAERIRAYWFAWASAYPETELYLP